MLEGIIDILVIVEILVTIVIGFIISVKADNDRDKYITTTLKNYIRELFIERNCFGMFISSIVFIIGIPTYLIIILIQITILIENLFMMIWNLGDKKCS